MNFTNDEINNAIEIESNLSKSILKVSEMSVADRQFLILMARKAQPKKILEFGTSAGAAGAIMFSALQGNEDFAQMKIYSVDILDNWYIDKTKPCGFIFDKVFPQYSTQQEKFFGCDYVLNAEKIGGNIDFVILDTAHTHPVETINFLCVLPYLKNGAVVVLHDISLCCNPEFVFNNKTATRILFSSVVADKIIPSDCLTTPDICDNIGAFLVSDDTRKYIYSMFSSLMMPWGNNFFKKSFDHFVPHNMFETYISFFKAHYGEKYSDMFIYALKAQGIMRQGVKKSFLKHIAEQTFVYDFYKKCKNKATLFNHFQEMLTYGKIPQTQNPVPLPQAVGNHKKTKPQQDNPAAAARRKSPYFQLKIGANL